MESLTKIFGSPSRLKTLRLFMFNQDSAFTLDEVAERLKFSKETAQREVRELLGSGLLRKRGERTSTRYQVNSRFEYLSALDEFIRDTTSVRPKSIAAALRHVGTLQLVVLSGFFTDVVESQIDLLIVGDRLDERAIARTVHSLEAELGREIRYASFATEDFRYRFGVYDRLLRDIFDYPHQRIINKIGI
jgi:predicted transcriptional regulator